MTTTEPLLVFSVGELDVDPERRELRRAGACVPIEPKAFDLLAYLIRHRDRVIPKQELLKELWGEEKLTDGVLAQCVWSARRALGDTGARQELIKTFHGRGYRFVGKVVGTGRPAGAAPVPEVRAQAVPASLEEPPFVGRTLQMRELGAALDSALAGRARLCLLDGEAGIGKTRTAEQVAGMARQSGAIVRIARCDEGEKAPPYWPWIQIVRHHAAGLDDAALAEQLGRGAADIAEVVPEIRQRLHELPDAGRVEPAQARFRLFDSFAAFVKRAAQAQPLLLVLDDLHCADRPSLLLLEFLARHIWSEPARVLVVATHREVELDHPFAPTLGALMREPATRRVSLLGLTEDDVATLAANVAGRPLPPSLVKELCHTTEGNPLFVTETVRLLAQERAASLDPEAGERRPASPTLTLPAGIRDLVLQRVARVSRACSALLQTASVLGRELSVKRLEALADAPPDRLLALLEEAAREGLVAEVRDDAGRFRFRHELTREILYRELSPTRRTSLHATVGALLASRMTGASSAAEISELAHHLYAALPVGDARTAAACLRRAGACAMTVMAYEEAVFHLERALRALDLVEDRTEAELCELLLALGEAQMRTGDRESARGTLDRAAKLARNQGTAEQLARVGLSLVPGFLFIETGVVDEALVSLLEEAASALGPADGALKAQVLGHAAMARYWRDPLEERDRRSAAALSMARRLKDESALPVVLASRLAATWGPRDASGRLALAREIIARAEQTGRQEIAMEASFLAVSTLLEAGRSDAADDEFRRFTQLASELRVPASTWYAMRYRATRNLMRGRFEDVERLCADYLAAGRDIEPANALHSFGTHMALLRWLQGRSGEILPEIEGAAGRNDRLVAWQGALALFYWEAGRHRDARRIFDDVARDAFSGVREDAHWLMAMSLFAEVCAHLRDPARAAMLYERLLEYEDRHASAYAVAYRGSVARYLGLLARITDRPDAAVRHFRKALAAEERAGARPFAALVELAWGQLALEQARNDAAWHEATRRIQRARETAQELGMDGVAREASELLTG